MQSSWNYINQDDFHRIIQAIPQLNLRGKKYNFVSVQMLFKISYNCALRISETLKLSKSDFLLDKNEVFLGKTKTENAGYSSIPEIFMPELESYLRSVQDERLFPDYNRKTVDSWTRKLGKRLEILAWTKPQSETHEKTKTHIFRKSYAKDLYRKAGTVIAMKKLRHKNLQVTSDYLKVGLDEVKAWEKLETPRK